MLFQRPCFLRKWLSHKPDLQNRRRTKNTSAPLQKHGLLLSFRTPNVILATASQGWIAMKVPGASPALATALQQPPL